MRDTTFLEMVKETKRYEFLWVTRSLDPRLSGFRLYKDQGHPVEEKQRALDWKEPSFQELWLHQQEPLQIHNFKAPRILDAAYSPRILDNFELSKTMS